MIDYGPLKVDVARGSVLLRGCEVKLRPVERRVLIQLMSDPDRVLTRRDLAESLWGEEPSADIRSVDTFITRLRRALGPASECIVTIRRVGYRFDPARLVLSR